jgi:GcrA cell cycle regulator
MRRFWTKARVVQLERLWRAGKTAAAIGAELGGISRTAVLGKIFRLRLAPAKTLRAAEAPDAPARRRGRKKQVQPAQPAKARRKTLLDLTNECCRWPYGELGSKRFFFCGEAGADLSRGIAYCPRHMQRAYIVPPSLVQPLHKLKIIAGAVARSSGDGKSTIRPLPRQWESKAQRFGSAS